jgi:hypothetical protein
LPANRGIGIAFLPTPLYLVLDFERRDFSDRHPLEELIQLVGTRKDFLSELISCAVGISRVALMIKRGLCSR